jgi:phosphoglycerate dehydrogenase-like enzyme
MVKIAVVNSTSFGIRFPRHLRALAALGRVKRFMLPSDISGAALARALKGYSLIIAGVNPDFSADFFKKSASGLKLIARHGIGYNNVDIKAATASGVLVTRVPGPLEREAVAEHALALLLACLRKIPQARAAAQKGQWKRRLSFAGEEIKGKTAGILGIGNIGTRTARILGDGFSARVLAFDPYLKPSVIRQRGAEPATFKRVLAKSDIVLLHCSLNPQNRHFINASAFKIMKPGAVLINTARGELIEMKSLVGALKSGRLSAFGADVVEGEPLDRRGHPLLKLDNAVIVPHIAAYTLQAMEAMGDKCVADIMDVVHHRRPKEIVNPEVLDRP